MKIKLGFNNFKWEDLCRVTYYDWLIWGIVALFAAIGFSQDYDMRSTTMQASELLPLVFQGRMTDFYQVILEKVQTGVYPSMDYLAVYNIFLYLTVAILITPVNLVYLMLGQPMNLDVTLVYLNVVFFGLVLYSGWVLRKLLQKFTSDKDSKIISYVYLTSPVLIYSILQFTQIDIIYLIISLYALGFYMEEKFHKFAFAISLAMIFKPFPIFIFIPLIVIVEKRIVYLALYLIEALSLSVITKYLFMSSEAYKITSDYIYGHFQQFGKFFSSVINIGRGPVNLFIISMIVICFICYCTAYQKRDIWKYIIVVPLTVYSVFTLFVAWNPQWICMLAPFGAMALGAVRNKKAYLIMNTFLTLGLLGLFLTWSPACDNFMINHGIFPLLTKKYYGGESFFNIINKVLGTNAQYYPSIVMSLIAGSILCMLFLSIKDIIKLKDYPPLDKSPVNRGYVYMQWIPLMIFNIASLYLYIIF